MNSKRDNGLYNWYPQEKSHRQTLMSQTSSLNTIIILIAGIQSSSASASSTSALHVDHHQHHSSWSPTAASPSDSGTLPSPLHLPVICNAFTLQMCWTIAWLDLTKKTPWRFWCRRHHGGSCWHRRTSLHRSTRCWFSKLSSPNCE